MEFDSIWCLPLDAALSRNERGAGWSEAGMVADFGGRKALLKRQRQYFCRPLWNGLRATPTFAREARLMGLASRAGVNVAELLYARHGSSGRMILAAAWIDGAVSLAAPEAQSESRLRATAAQFVRLHQARICHGALYDRHVLIDRAGVITLIDFEKARRRLTPSWAAIGDLARFIRRSPWLTPEQIDLIVAAYHWRHFPLLRVWARFWR